MPYQESGMLKTTIKKSSKWEFMNISNLLQFINLWRISSRAENSFEPKKKESSVALKVREAYTYAKEDYDWDDKTTLMIKICCYLIQIEKVLQEQHDRTSRKTETFL